MSDDRFNWWSNLRHGGLLLDTPRRTALIPTDPDDLSAFDQDRLRRRLTQFKDDASVHRGEFVSFVLEAICGFARPLGEWYRGADVKTQWSRKAITGESIRPRHLWIGKNGATLPVFVDDQHRLGVGKGRRIVSHVLGWLRQGKEQLAVITNGQEWRLVFAGLDYEAFCQWDIDSWFAEGSASPELNGLRALVAPALWTPTKEGDACPLLEAINSSRKGQADLSQILGERVRQAAELLIQAHTPALKEHIDGLASQDIYRAAVRMIMRLVVVLFAESREGLLVRDNPVFHSAYSLQGLREQLERISNYKLASGVGAYPRILGLLRLIYQGSSHPALLVPAYGGELFAPGRADDADGMKRALHLFETACFGEHSAVVMTDFHVRQILELLTRTKVKIRQGRATLLVPAPVDFSSLDSEYIGILYEGLLDFELRCAVQDEPIVFLAVGNQPALPLTTLLAMDDRAIKNLLEKLKDTSSDDDGESDDGEGDDADEAADQEQAAESEDDANEDESPAVEESEGIDPAAEPAADDPRFSLRQRAEEWALRACRVGSLVTKPRGRITPETQMRYDRALASKARQIVVKVVLPGEWYLVRWGGTRKGSGTFYTRPQLAIPTVHRTLRPLAYDPPLGADGRPDFGAPAKSWTPKKPEDILRLKVCDPACGSGSFPLSALRFLTNALYESLVFHGRIHDHGGRAVLDLIHDETTQKTLSSEALPCRPDDDDFEPRTLAILRRYVVERCIYGVDLDPLAVELCRLSLWIETMDRSLPLTFLNHKIKCGNSLVGAWFDQFMHYPVMAWEREGGDKNHSNGVHFPKEGWTKAIKAFKALVKPDLIAFIDGGRLIYSVDLTTVRTGHDAAESALAEIHELGIAQVDQRAARYEALVASAEFQQLKAAFDLWCALWFWPADKLDHAPLPTQFAAGEIDDEAHQIARDVARERRFFHWELEFPDVFSTRAHGFDVVLGNPPWDIAKPNSKEFFSALDPLYRGYGKQEAIDKQREMFAIATNTTNAAGEPGGVSPQTPTNAHDHNVRGLTPIGSPNSPSDRGVGCETERRWLAYNAWFRAQSNWVKYAAFPFGDRVTVNSQGKSEHDFPLGDRGRGSFESSQRRHDKWRMKREETTGYADAEHSFRHQGSGDLNLYKLFLEQAHLLLREGGRLGFIVPSGLYSDHGTGGLRTLFLDRCQWEWLFGFENRNGIFDIHRSFKFNPVIVQKGGRTQAIRAAFMRRQLADWERGEAFVTEYPRERVLQFSPRSKAILEIQSRRDLEVLEKIYSHSVLLGDDGPDGWGIRYATEFHMTNDSKLFPPRPWWEEQGYRPDEYSRWLKGNWQPIEQLWPELGITPLPADERRCAQPPYDRLPVSRSDIPEGIILSRAATHFIREEDIDTAIATDRDGSPITDDEDEPIIGATVALPLYQGLMTNVVEHNSAAWESGTGLLAKWNFVDEHSMAFSPQYLIRSVLCPAGCRENSDLRYAFRDIARSTDQRSMIGSLIARFPAGNTLPVLQSSKSPLAMTASIVSLTYDWAVRERLAATHLNFFVIAETPLLPHSSGAQLEAETVTASLVLNSQIFASDWLRLLTKIRSLSNRAWRHLWARTLHERLRLRCVLEAIAAARYEVSEYDLSFILRDCDWPQELAESKAFTNELDQKGFWRVDKDKPPEQRLTVLSLVAFHDLQQQIAACGGDVTRGIEEFCSQHDGEGWQLPETLRLADYGLGHDNRATQPQPVRACFGPRFYDWQLAQSPEESWRECHLHTRNLLGPEGYQALLDELEGKAVASDQCPVAGEDKSQSATIDKQGQKLLFDTEPPRLF